MSPVLPIETPPNWNFYNNPRHPYDEFFPTYIGKPLKYEFVKQHYDRQLSDLAAEIPDLPHRLTTVFGPGVEGWIADSVRYIEKAGIRTVYDLLAEVSTRTQAEAFLARSGLPQPYLMGLMDYLKQWWFPYPATLRQLVEGGDPILEKALNQLKAVKIANSFSLLEAGGSESGGSGAQGGAQSGAQSGAQCGRKKLSAETGIPQLILLNLVHRADVSRLPYTSGGAVRRLWAMGYTCLADLRHADPREYQRKVEAYFAAGGKGSLFDAKLENILSFLKEARHAPEVVDGDS
jgi:hypothetical protein